LKSAARPHYRRKIHALESADEPTCYRECRSENTEFARRARTARSRCWCAPVMTPGQSPETRPGKHRNIPPHHDPELHEELTASAPMSRAALTRPMNLIPQRAQGAGTSTTPANDTAYHSRRQRHDRSNGRARKAETPTNFLGKRRAPHRPARLLHRVKLATLRAHRTGSKQRRSFSRGALHSAASPAATPAPGDRRLLVVFGSAREFL
jgi:hypothetical protein